MNFRKDLEQFSATHPFQTMTLSGKTVHYLLCGREDCPYTLVYFVGGTGNPLGWYRHVLAMEKKYRILLTDYPMGCDALEPMIGLLGQLVEQLEIQRAVWIGASLGGYIAQLMARAYPKKTHAMVLYATTALTAESLSQLEQKYRYVGKLLWAMEHLPYGMLKFLFLKPSLTHLVPKGNSDQAAYVKDFARWIYDDYTREKDLHMTRLMADLIHVRPETPEDFRFLQGRILLILPENDKAFTPQMQQALIELMEGARTEKMEGGHLSTLCSAEAYAAMTDGFLQTLG